MIKNFLIFNSLIEKQDLLTRIIKELRLLGCNFLLLSGSGDLLRSWRENNWPQHQLMSWLDFRLPTWQLWWWRGCYLLLLLYYKYWQKYTAVICLNYPEKILITPLALRLGYKVFWLEYPNQAVASRGARLNKFLLKYAPLVKIMTFSPTTTADLSQLWGLDNIATLAPAIATEEFLYQENIFHKLATGNRAEFYKNNFTIGTVVDLNQPHNLEILLAAVKICLNIIRPLQLVVVGEGEAKKHLTWLIHKLNLNNDVWLVGNQVSMKRWFGNFDLLVVTDPAPILQNWLAVLGAMVNGLPVLAHREASLSDIIIDQKTGGLLDIRDSEALASAIISLYQNPDLRKNWGEEAKDTVLKFYQLPRLIRDFSAILQ